MELSKKILDFDRTTEILQKNISPHEKLIDWVRYCERRGIDSKAFMEKKGRQGTRIHKYIQSRLEGKKTRIPKKWNHVVQAMLDYFNGIDVRCEIPVWMENPIPYRGTLDYFYKMSGQNYIGDFKSGRPSRTHALQLNAYADAYEDMTGEHIHHLEIFYMKEEGIEIVEVERKRGIFQSVLQIHEFFKRQESKREKN